MQRCTACQSRAYASFTWLMIEIDIASANSVLFMESACASNSCSYMSDRLSIIKITVAADATEPVACIIVALTAQ